MYHILLRVSEGHANAHDLVTLRELADNIHSKTICFFGASAAMPVQSFLTKFRDEFVARLDAQSAAGIGGSPAAHSFSGAAGLPAGRLIVATTEAPKAPHIRDPQGDYPERSPSGAA